jgi:LPS-assembly lipoprotein
MWWCDSVAAPCTGRRQWLLQASRLGVAVAAALTLPALGGCGFALRRSPVLAFQHVALSGFSAQSALARDLRAALAAQVKVVDAPEQSEVVLQSLEDTLARVVVASTSASQVREIQLRMGLRFRILGASGRELAPPAELLLTRDLSYNETQALAKAQEEAQILRDMRADIVQQVMRRLGAVRL